MKHYTYEEAFKASTDYFLGDELAASVFVDKYLLRDNEDHLLEKTPTDMHWRMAKEFARIEKTKFKTPLTEEEIFNLFDHFRYIVPQGSPMSGIGNDYQKTSLSNCFLVESPEDSYADILRIDEQIVQVSKRRGGAGVDISKLRPAGTQTQNAGRTSSGIIPFMKRFANSIGEVAQNGRRGALMMTISVHHPQIHDFIHAKEIKTDEKGNKIQEITGANISIRLSDEFLEAVDKDKDYELRWPVDSKTPKISKMVSATKIWNEIIQQAHAWAEPGLLLWDNALRETPSSAYENFKPVSTNPCGEIILSPLDSCRLLLLNLLSYVKNPFTKDAKFDFELFSQHSKIAQRLMDDLVDLEAEKIQKIVNKVKSDPESDYIKCRELDMWTKILENNNNGRRTGTGTTSFGDTLAALGIKYDSDEALRKANKIFKCFKLACYRSSVDMAKELGHFTDYDASKEKKHPFIQRIKDEDPELYADMVKYGRRNIALTTLAPAGSVSLLTRTTSGLEPLYMHIHDRRKKINAGDKDVKVDEIDAQGIKWHKYLVKHPTLSIWTQVTGETDFKKSPWFGCEAADINWEHKIKMQAIIQKNICHSLSNTCNLPPTATVKDVAKIFETAWKSGCKGVTIYRQNSRDGVLVETEIPFETDNVKDEVSEYQKEIPIIKAPKRPKELPCDIHHIKITKKLDKIRTFDYMVLIGLYNKTQPYEVFAVENGKYDKKINKGKIIKEAKGRYHLVMSDGTEIKDITKNTTENEDAVTRLISSGLRHGIDITSTCEQLIKVANEEGNLYGYCKSLARALKTYIKEGTISNDTCVKCGAKLVFEDGCFICKGCGVSKCS